MKLERNDIAALICFALAGMFNACMDFKMFHTGSWMLTLFESLGLKSWYLAEGGNAVWRKLGLVWDFWHVMKNLMLVSIGLGVACATRNWRWVFAAPVIGLSFILFFHLIFGAHG
jgi:hypothetical protein